MRVEGKDYNQAVPAPILRGPPRLYATEGAKDGFGPYRASMEKYLPRMAESDVLILRPADLLRPGEEPVDMNKLRQTDPQSYLDRLDHMSHVLEDFPGWRTSLPDLSNSAAEFIDFSPEEQQQIYAMAEMYQDVTLGNHGPMATLNYNFDRNILVINMFDTPEETRDFIFDHLSGLPESLSDGFPDVSARDWHVLTILHEASHGPTNRRLVSGESRYEGGSDPNNQWLAYSLDVLDGETEADRNAIKNYFNIRAEGLPLAANSPELLEALRAIGTLERSSDLESNWIDDFNSHMTSPFYDVLENTEKAGEAFGAPEAVPAALYINTMAERLIEAAPEQHYYGAGNSLPLPLKRYVAVKQLYDAGQFEEGTPEQVIAREYLEAFENYVPEVNDPASEAYGARLKRIYETDTSLQTSLCDPALKEERFSLENKFKAMAAGEAPDGFLRPQEPVFDSGLEDKPGFKKIIKPESP